LLGLDLFTLAVVSVLNFLLAAVVLLAVRFLDRRCRGLRRCVFACLLLAAGFAVLAVDLNSAGLVRLILVNTLFSVGAVFYLDGIRAFREHSRRLWIYGIVLSLFFLSIAWFLFVHNNAGARIAIRAFFLAALMLTAVFAMAIDVPKRERYVYWSTAALSALFCIALAARGISAMTAHRVDLFRTGPIDFFTIVIVNVWVLGGAFGLTIATNLRLQRQTEKLALFDALTGLPNRRHFEEWLEQSERGAVAGGHRLALIFCDLDHFKKINDTLGHEAGDDALRLVAKRMREVVGDDGCLARVGGDEFIVLLEDAPPREEVNALIHRLRQRVGGSVGPPGRAIPLQISCGVAMFPEEVANATDLIRLADGAMYLQKQQGRAVAAELVGEA
jgi:diguanylate cyclase (GGDEF)-like protein